MNMRNVDLAVSWNTICLKLFYLYILLELKLILFQVTQVLVNYNNPHLAHTDPHALLLLLQLM